MAAFNRRSFITAASVASASVFAPSAFAHTIKTEGEWSARADMPFPVQEIYPAPFRARQSTQRSLKPSAFNLIVNAGGLTPDAPNNVTNRTVWYDPEADKWGEGAPLPAPRHHLMLVNNNGYLYGIGGFSRDAAAGWRMTQDCWRLDDIYGAWTPAAALPHPQAEAVCQSLGGFVHVVGGRAPSGSRNRDWSDHIDTDAHWLFDAAANRWVDMAPLPTPRNSAAGAVVNGVLYVIGGRTVRDGNTDVVEVYDPLSNRWETVRPMPKAQGGLAAAVLKGKIYAFGGEYFDPGGGGVYQDVWEYDPRSDRWRAGSPMPRPRHGLGAVSIGDAIYVIGGAAEAGGSQTSAANDSFRIGT